MSGPWPSRVARKRKSSKCGDAYDGHAEEDENEGAASLLDELSELKVTTVINR